MKNDKRGCVFKIMPMQWLTFYLFHKTNIGLKRYPMHIAYHTRLRNGITLWKLVWFLRLYCKLQNRFNETGSEIQNSGYYFYHYWYVSVLESCWWRWWWRRPWNGWNWWKRWRWWLCIGWGKWNFWKVKKWSCFLYVYVEYPDIMFFSTGRDSQFPNVVWLQSSNQWLDETKLAA